MAKVKCETGEVDVSDGDSITAACEHLGVTFGCYAGECGSCRIEVIEGSENLSELSDEEKKLGMDKTHRLACQTRIKSGEVKLKW
jgi:ferredoxin